MLWWYILKVSILYILQMKVRALVGTMDPPVCRCHFLNRWSMKYTSQCFSKYNLVDVDKETKDKWRSYVGYEAIDRALGHKSSLDDSFHFRFIPSELHILVICVYDLAIINQLLVYCTFLYLSRNCYYKFKGRKMAMLGNGTQEVSVKRVIL